MTKTCLLWDFDGTLAYRDGMWTASVSAVLDKNGYLKYDKQVISKTMQPYYPWAKHELAHDEYFGELSWWEYIEQNVVGRALSAINIEGNKKEKLAKQFRSEYLRLDMWHLFSDAKVSLEKSIELGYDNVILSNHTPELRQITDYLGITKYFTHVITSAEIGYEKPNPKFYETIKQFGTYDRFIMIGDNYFADVLGAKAYGMEAILVRKPNDMGCDSYAEDLRGIWKYLL